MSWFRFAFLFDLLEFCHLSYPFLIHNEMNAAQFKLKEHNYFLNLPIATNVSGYICDIIFCSHVFILFYRWLYTLNVNLFSSNLLNTFRSPSPYSLIYSEKYALYLGKF